MSNLAVVTEPSTKLLKKMANLCGPLLLAPNSYAPFRLAVDACNIKLGTVFLQVDAAELERPVTYFFKKQNKHQGINSKIDEEALGLVLAIKHFGVYSSHFRSRGFGVHRP